MRIPRQFVPALRARRGDVPALVGMMGLYLLVLFAVGVLRPIRNSIALDGLAATEFYKVYFVSAVVVAGVPLYNTLARKIALRRLIPAVGAFFAANLVLLRVLYSPADATFGLIFYGWYELFAAALVTQVFLAVQLTFDHRSARSAVPLIIVGGSIGATLGGLTTATLAKVVGTPNLMWIAAACLTAFALSLGRLWPADPPGSGDSGPETPATRPAHTRQTPEHGEPAPDTRSPMARVRIHLALIGSLVLLTVVVKTMVDYLFNEAVAQHAGDLDSTSSFLGYVLSATQWLPIPVLLALRSVLVRWGLGVVVLVLPVVMLSVTGALAIWFSVWTAVFAKACDTTFRYSAERTAREVLYFPVREGPRLRAKTYIDMAVEKGVGKVTTALLIMLLLERMGYQSIAWVAMALCVGWIGVALAARATYLRALAEALTGRYATSAGGFASLAERRIKAGMSDALQGKTEDVHFALDILEEAGHLDVRALGKELGLLLEHERRDLRSGVLSFLERHPGVVSDDDIRASTAGRERHQAE